MTVSFRLGRYLVALLWHWAPPAIIGFAFGSVMTTFQAVEVLEAADDYFYKALTQVVQQCAVTDTSTDSEAEQVQGRAPGSSDHASPIRRTEARAERTLDPARTETASALECGESFSPRAPEPSAARVG